MTALETPAQERSTYAWFTTLWPLAVIFHLAGNDWFLLNFTNVGVLQVPFLLAAVAMLLRPTHLTAAFLAISHLPVVLAKLPAVGNHEILLLMIDLAVILAVATRGKKWVPAVVPPLRWVLLIAYSAIAFSKVNSSFVDRAVSCAVIFGDEFGDWVNVSVSNSALLSYMVIAMTLLFELSIPIMLMIRPLRRFGVVVAMIFHTLLALEPNGHVFDFTSVLFVLFLLFLTPEASQELNTAVQRVRDRLGTNGIAVILLVMAVGNLLMFRARTNGYNGPSWLFDFPFWLAYAAFLFRTVLPTVRRPASDQEPIRTSAPKLAFKMAPIMAVVVLLTSLNAASPYLEVRTAGAFNMYSNLATSNGETNHLLLPRTFPLGDSPRFFAYEPDPANPNVLDFYASAGDFIVPESNLAEWARTVPGFDVDVQIARGEGAPQTVSMQQMAADFGPTGRFVDNVLYVRAIDPEQPTNCRRFWGPAH